MLLPCDNVPILSMDELFLSAPNSQATNQLLAIIVTLAFATVVVDIAAVSAVVVAVFVVAV